jgi:hypothetical protein
MTVTMDEFEEFIQVYKDQGIEKAREEDLRKAIRHFWNVASSVTVDDRVQTLREEGWIEKEPHSNTFRINHELDDPVIKAFKNRGVSDE